MLTAIGFTAIGFTIYVIRLWPGDQYLCDNCCFNDPKCCFKPERPNALICFAYKIKKEV